MILDLKRRINDLTQQVVVAQAQATRADQQNSVLGRQVDALLKEASRRDARDADDKKTCSASSTVARIRKEHERSLIVKRLREQIDGLRTAVNERDDLIASLRRSQRNSVILELEMAKEEYFAETLRLKNELRRHDDKHRSVRTALVDLLSDEDDNEPVRPHPPPPREDDDDEISRKSPVEKKRRRRQKSPVRVVREKAPSQDALRLLYKEAREIAVNSAATGFGVPSFDAKRVTYASKKPSKKDAVEPKPSSKRPVSANPYRSPRGKKNVTISPTSATDNKVVPASPSSDLFAYSPDTQTSANQYVSPPGTASTPVSKTFDDPPPPADAPASEPQPDLETDAAEKPTVETTNDAASAAEDSTGESYADDFQDDETRSK